ncbi:hypothetical protein AGABI2DRAFT_206407 [Agaricus bisporus var. bisporus H97]|uniref:hypothetical protein n=1 Tax=Agaricus bisporus var. bisporus (strain H97 / ATCC MYA-4626 / FGSC 10389) TaxID=936046 RepID=UPI00029F79FA|nr:hypothetical protein AGABI2DRAFT_206407 [Agaricus bisporus var. bisporus H97]EKV46834.1 hypothetical protein AGABI2DRAFT_206407 [Agaricus bisporus var. bisporus H97]
MDNFPSPLPPFIINSVRIPAGAEIVTDPDEEVFLLYSELQRTKSNSTSNDGISSSPSTATATTVLDPPQHRGLGHVDSRRNILSVVIELKGGEEELPQLPASEIELHYKSTKRTRTREKKKKKIRYIEDKTIEIDLLQDVTGLRSRKGDTGSVLWHASVDFARFVLQQAHLRSPECIFNLEMLKHQHILELGAGTGILSILLSPLCHRYTVTDIEELVPLIQKNVELNVPKGSGLSSNIQVLPLDWVALKNTPPARRHLLLPYSLQENVAEEQTATPVDILLIVDCIYHPSLLPPLIETINHLTRPNKKTIVMVVVELRSDQVVREFLELWIDSGNQSSMKWKIYRCPLGIIAGPYVVWIGWKEESNNNL